MMAMLREVRYGMGFQREMGMARQIAEDPHPHY